MKKIVASLLSIASISAYASAPELPDLASRAELEKVSNEFAVNFSHTVVAAPETDGLWGVEVGLVGGSTSSPKLAGLIDRAGEDGSKFKNLYHGGLMARAHFPLELFAEVSFLPERKISDVSVGNRSLGLGWNAGSYFNLPLDVAVGWNMSSTDVSFSQVINNASTANQPVNSKINFDANTSVFWTGVSKKFAIVTPYIKAGLARSEADAEISGTTGTIFTFSQSQKENVSSSGGYLAAGANLELLFFRMGIEASQTINVKRISGKLSVAF
jgi:hypothetical protein